MHCISKISLPYDSSLKTIITWRIRVEFVHEEEFICHCKHKHSSPINMELYFLFNFEIQKMWFHLFWNDFIQIFIVRLEIDQILNISHVIVCVKQAVFILLNFSWHTYNIARYKGLLFGTLERSQYTRTWNSRLRAGIYYFFISKYKVLGGEIIHEKVICKLSINPDVLINFLYQSCTLCISTYNLRNLMIFFSTLNFKVLQI